MKVKVISRNDEDFTRQGSRDIYKVHRNLHPTQHPFEKAREYTRALNATKLERMFAKPYVGTLSGHMDGVFCLAKHPTNITTVLSGACDGEIKVWNLKSLNDQWTVQAHKGYVRGLSVGPFGSSYVSVGEDKTIKLWALDDAETEADRHTPANVWLGKHAFTGVDHHRSRGQFATSGTLLEVWDHNRSEPINAFPGSTDTVISVKFNPVERDIVATCATDRSIALYDVRAGSAMQRLVLQMRSNALCWNPMEAFNFTVANEDHNCYTYDMRRMDTARNVHKDHVSAVMSLDYSPTGREFVTGSYDRSVRMFGVLQGHSQEVYHTKRMQRVFAVLWSQDAKYVLSASDDANIRLWKARAAEKLGALTTREKTSLQYAEKLREKFRHHPEIKSIARHRHLPKAIKKAAEVKRVMAASAKRKEDNRRRHSKPGAVPFVAQRKKPVVAVQD